MMLVASIVFSQTVYSESMGTPSSTTLITNYTGWQNSTPIAYSGSGDVRTSSASSGYTGASGGGNVFLTSTGVKDFIISGINTSSYMSSGLTLSFGYSTNSVATQMTVEQSTNGTTWTPISFTQNTNTSWNLVTITGQLAVSSTLSLRFTQPATAQMRVDDVKIVYVNSACALSPGAPLTACAASTLGIDNYTITIPFTGGGTSTYTVAATTGTVGGDNPSTTASGNIIITGTPEGTANTVTITGGSCNFSIAVAAPVGGCKPVNTLPYSENFNYTAGASLNDQQKWNIQNSGDNITVVAGNLTYPGVTYTGNSISFAGAGAESQTPFTSTTSGTVNASFIFSATDYSNVTTDLDNTYFALFTSDTAGSTNARVWIRKNGTQYQFGLGAGSAPDTWSSNLYNVGSVQYLTLSYNFATNRLSLFENQVTPTTETIGVTPTTAYTNIGGFMIRQDAANLTPTIQMDELMINVNNVVLAVSDVKKSNNLFIKNTLVKNDEITFGSDVKDIKIYTLSGAVVKTGSVKNGATLNVAELAKGNYIVTGMVNNQPVSQKILKD